MFYKHVLKNGLRVVTVPLKNTKTVTVLVMVETGSKYETKKTNGISHFLEHMFFKGTKRRPDTLSLASEIDRIGGEHNAFTAKEFTGYYGKAARKHQDLLLDILSDMYLHSKLEQAEIERERGVICEEINMRQDLPMVLVSDLFEKLLYADQPAGWLTIGTKENVGLFTREDLKEYLAKHYLASNTIVFVAGNLAGPASPVLGQGGTEVQMKVQKYFGQMRSGDPPKRRPVRERQKEPQILAHQKETDQTHLCLGLRAYSAKHPDYFGLKVLSAVLGEGMSSRLFISVRERRGLAYYIRSELSAYTDSGYLAVQAGVPNDKLDQAVKIILEEFNQIKDKEIDKKELKKSKEYLKGKLLLDLEASDELAFWLAGQEVLRGKMLGVPQVLKKIDAVSGSDLKRIGQDIFQDQGLNLAVIGPGKDEEDLKKILKF